MRNLKDAVAQGDTAHQDAAQDRRGRWKHPIAGLSSYRTVKRDFAALPDDTNQGS